MPEKYDPRLHFWRNRVLLPAALRVVAPILVRIKGARCAPFRTRSPAFLLVSNHTEVLDPAYEMYSLMRYIRYVSSDHVVRDGFSGWFLNTFGTPIVKHRDHPKEELTCRILQTLQAGTPVGLHAEGGTSINGESRYIPPNTAKLAKDSGCALITYRIAGGYLRSPRWKKHRRKGPLRCGVVREYSPQELAAMTQEEVYAAICRDLYVNAYEEQRAHPQPYPGKDLAESCEIVLYRCPACGAVGNLRSKGSLLSCSCGYAVAMGEDGFFHPRSGALAYDTVLSWDLWQRQSLPALLDTFRSRPDTPIFHDEGQTIAKVTGDTETLLSAAGTVTLYWDRLELAWEGERWSAPLFAIHRLDYVKRQSLLVLTQEVYWTVGSALPRSPIKYIDAWRYLTGRPNLRGGAPT